MYRMKTYRVGMVRERLAQALDQAERGEPVFIERRNVTYRLSVEPRKPARRRAQPIIEVLDPVIASGQWTWNWEGGQLRVQTRRRA
jgi:antitoxin (DNA-binding transcriptional repressor) of toxin-antitoxin stability system